LSSTYVSLPGEVSVGGAAELEFTAPVEISAAKIRLQAATLILRPPFSSEREKHVVLEAGILESSVGSILTNGVQLVLAVADRAGLGHPAFQYVEERRVLSTDPLLREKYLRLCRILVHFRSHRRGRLAKYKYKVEHWRVLGNDTGWAILRRCLKDGILTLEGSFYFLQPENVDKHLGISWPDLRKGRTSPKLEEYLRSVN
jgi:hypothetical protein